MYIWCGVWCVFVKRDLLLLFLIMHSQYFFTKNTVIITKIKSSIYIMSYKTFLHVHAFGNCRIPLTNSSGVMIKMTIDINTITKPRYITNISKMNVVLLGTKIFYVMRRLTV